MKVESRLAHPVRSEAAPRVTLLDGSRTLGPGALSAKAAAELLTQGNAGESDPFIEIVIGRDLY